MTQEVPPAIRQAIARFLRYCASTFELIWLTQDGARLLVGWDRTYSTLDVPPRDEDDQLFLSGMRQRADVATQELSLGFPLLHGHALLGAWGALEACLDDVCVGWLEERGVETAREALSRLKVPLAEVLTLDGAEKWEWVFEHLRRATDASLKPGVGQFEALLGAVGLGGDVDDTIRDVLFYSKAIRNVLAHRSGRADARLVRDCPRLGLRVGDPVNMTYDHIRAALTAMVIYVDVVRVRIERGQGRDAEVDFPPWADLAAMRDAFVGHEPTGD